jgi:hypothetical protein
MQWSGIHLHVNLHSQDATPHLSQMHGLEHQHNDHQHEVDVDLADISTNWFKLLQIFIVTALILLCLSLSYKTSRLPYFSQHLHNKQSYWRPILRAPPA